MRMQARKTARPKKKQGVALYLDRITRSARNVSTRTIWIAVCAIFGAAVLIGAATSGAPQDKAAAHAAARPSTTAAAATVTGASADPVVPPAPAPTAADALAAAKANAMTTITGCLEREDAAYRLKDTDGDAAPRARSWKTGFLKKASRPIDLYDTANRVKLPAHVGQRISVTGELVDREMYVRSVHRVSPSCSTKS
jgi:hypothetical protein